MTDGQELTGRLGAHGSCQGALQGADSGEGFADFWQREQTKTCHSQRLPHTTLRHYKNTFFFFNVPFLN